MSNHIAGHSAELRAARYLQHQGFRIRRLNWRTKVCEIDIIAEKDRQTYFVEVKYQRSDRWGEATDRVTAAKLARMRFAAHCWLAYHDDPHDSCLATVVITGTLFKLEIIDFG